MSKFISSPVVLPVYSDNSDNMDNNIEVAIVLDGITRRKVDLPGCAIRKCVEFIGTYSDPNGKGSSFARGKRTIKHELRNLNCSTNSIKSLFQAAFKFHARYKDQYGYYEIKYDPETCAYVLNYIIEYVKKNASEAMKKKLLGDAFESDTFYGTQLSRLKWLAACCDDPQNKPANKLLGQLTPLKY